MNSAGRLVVGLYHKVRDQQDVNVPTNGADGPHGTQDAVRERNSDIEKQHWIGLQCISTCLLLGIVQIFLLVVVGFGYRAQSYHEWGESLARLEKCDGMIPSSCVLSSSNTTTIFYDTLQKDTDNKVFRSVLFAIRASLVGGVANISLIQVFVVRFVLNRFMRCFLF